jgi:hypothetical protein
MTTHPSKGYYCLVQYCPDLGRLESANIGVLLFCPDRDFLQAKTAHNNARIIKFFGSEGHDWIQINSFKRGIEERLVKESGEIETVEDLHHFIALRANQIQITAPRPMKVTNPSEDLDKLFAEFIGEPVRRISKKGLQRQIEDRLKRAGLASKIETDITVAVPVFNKQLHIPFAYQNGVFNLLNPVTFEAKSPEASLNQACRYAVLGEYINETSHPTYGKQQFCVVGRFRPKDQETRDGVKAIFQKHSIKLYRADRLDSLIHEIQEHGRVLHSKTIPDEK